ncbi:hypothetical protein BJV82DRAFT_615198 [Fennellomyces sp. T-0311]|nr:hypothetical protein BJV82DRAFT_615198 [Fennellomyces sp. T-0311]
MTPIKNAYGAIVTTVTSPISTVERALQERKQRTAQKRIEKQASKEAEVCLTLGRSYRKRNNLLAARDVYKQGLLSLSMDDAQHTHLQKELQVVSATIRAYNRQLFIIPQEIWYRIFKHLRTYRDLWQCAMASNTWYNILTNVSEFWNPPWCTDSWEWIAKKHSASDTEPSTIQIGRTEPGFLFHGNEWWFQDLFTVLACWSENTFEVIGIRYPPYQKCL